MKALTIDELKALEVGDWVWVVFTYGDKISSLYEEICGAISDSCFSTRKNTYYYSGYGKTWLAYKNK